MHNNPFEPTEWQEPNYPQWQGPVQPTARKTSRNIVGVRPPTTEIMSPSIEEITNRMQTLELHQRENAQQRNIKDFTENEFVDLIQQVIRTENNRNNPRNYYPDQRNYQQNDNRFNNRTNNRPNNRNDNRNNWMNRNCNEHQNQNVDPTRNTNYTNRNPNYNQNSRQDQYAEHRRYNDQQRNRPNTPENLTALISDDNDNEYNKELFSAQTKQVKPTDRELRQRTRNAQVRKAKHSMRTNKSDENIILDITDEEEANQENQQTQQPYKVTFADNNIAQTGNSSFETQPTAPQINLPTHNMANDAWQQYRSHAEHMDLDTSPIASPPRMPTNDFI